MTVEILDVGLLVGAVVVIVAVGAIRVSTRFGVPSLLAYLALGFALGHLGVGVHAPNLTLVEGLSLVALAVIVAEGGLNTRLPEVRPVAAVSLLLATVGVLVSVTVVAGVAYLIVGLDLRLSVLLGAALAPTDAAAVFATLRRLPVLPRLAATLEAESGINDPIVVILVLEVATQGWPLRAGPFLLHVAVQLGGGLLAGLVVGWFGAWLLSRSALPSPGLYPVSVIALCLVAYTGASVAGASGFVAVYVAAVWLGNADLPHRGSVVGFAEGLAWVAQIGLFVLLGLLADPAGMASVALPALVVVVALLVLARPLSVLASSVRSGLPARHRAFLSWAGLRGAVPIVLAVIPLASGLAGADRVFDIVTLAVIVSTAVQGPTLPAVARWLGVSAAGESHEVFFEWAPLGDGHAQVLSLTIAAGSRLSGVEIAELRLPHGAAVGLVTRGGEPLSPRPTLRLQPHDALLVITATRVRDQTERRLRAVSRGGRLAGWFGERGDP